MQNFVRKTVYITCCITIVFVLTFDNVDNYDNYETTNTHYGQKFREVNSNDSEINVQNAQKLNKAEKQLPKVAVVGVKKCGTGALIEVMRMHPGIVAPPFNRIEVPLWDEEESMENGLEYYKSLMPVVKQNQMVAVKIPGLTKSGNPMNRALLHEAMPDLKLLMIVRNPITRIVSHIIHEYDNHGGLFWGKEMPDIDDLIMGRVPDIDDGNFLLHLLQISNYKRIYDNFSSHFPKESILIVNGDALIKHPVEETKKVEKFLGLGDFYKKQHFFYHADNGGKFPCFTVPEMRCMGNDKGRPHPQLRQETVSYLKKILQPLMDEFKEETGVEVVL